MALAWLIDCGLIYSISRVSKPSMPLKAYEERSSFKIYLVDVGLLAAMCDVDAKTILDKNSIFTEFKGALTEQYVLQQLICSGHDAIHYWSAERSTAEVDFVLQHHGQILPIEVKAEENLQSKSIKVFHEKFSTPISIRFSMSDFRHQDWLVNMPLYAVSELVNMEF